MSYIFNIYNRSTTHSIPLQNIQSQLLFFQRQLLITMTTPYINIRTLLTVRA